ncbi:MAG: hypothetical protein QOG20_1387 [Pseudonocardiales bacterium]|nr:hypothetical protein [Pseudonocardiales bacterium]
MTSTHTRGDGDRRQGGVDPAASMRPGVDIDPPTTALPIQVAPTTPPTPPAPPAAQASVGVFRWLSPLLALLAVAMLPIAAATTDLESLDGWGLAKVLGPAAWAALLLAVSACVAELRSPRPRIPMLGTATGVLILCSTGMPSVVEPVARFSTAWLLAGFTDSIAQTGAAPSGIDARFYWPAFFAQWAFFRDAGGATQLDTVLRWFPPAVVTVWTIGIYALARSMLGGSRAPWAAAWLFVGLNWIEQDYFSPQATGIVLMVTVLTFALGPLATRRTDPAGVPGWPPPHEDAPRLAVFRRWMVSALTPPNRPTLPPRQLLLIYFCASLCLLAAAPEHQITPFAIVGQLVLLAVVGRFRGRGLILVGVVAITVFILIEGREFWINQLGLIIGSGDQGALQAGVADRLTGDTGQVVVKYLRVLVPGLTWLLAIVGAWTYWKRRRDLVPIGLAVVPMVFAAVQSYGGELILRIVLYGLPILSILGADALRALVRNRGRSTEIVLAVGMAVLFGVLVLIRGGNDSYQVVFPQEVAMYRQVSAETPKGGQIVALSGLGPTGVVGLNLHGSGVLFGQCVNLADDPIRCARSTNAPAAIVSYTSIEKQGVYLYGKNPGWSLAVLQQLVASGRYVITYQDGFNWAVKQVGAPA